MDERNPTTGLPVSPADTVMREAPRLSAEELARECDTAWADPCVERPKVARGAVLVAWAVVAALFIAGCGGEVKTTVDLTEDPPVEVRWEIQVKALCGVPVKERMEWMNRVNNEWLNEAFVLVACPGIDMLNTEAKPLLVDGAPALGVQVQAIYLLPGMGERVKNNGGGEPSVPTEYAGVCRGKGNRIAPTLC